MYPCRQCQVEDELMKQRQNFEKNEYLRLNEQSRLNQLLKSSNYSYKNCGQANGICQATNKEYAISMSWFKQWEQFVQFKQCPQLHQIPGKINNYSICLQQGLKNSIFQLNKSMNASNINNMNNFSKFVLAFYLILFHHIFRFELLQNKRRRMEIFI